MLKFAHIAAVAGIMDALTGAGLAADLGRPAPAAVDYVRVCDSYGQGFFYIPGTETCLKVGGLVRAQVIGGADSGYNAISAILPYYSNFGSGRQDNRFQTQSRLYLSADARSSTSWGILRAYGEISVSATSGGYAKAASNTAALEKAFIQFGYLTAGHTASMWDFYTGSATGFLYGDEVHDGNTNLLAYTFDFGEGWSSTISLEDPTFVGRYDYIVNGGGQYYGGLKVPDIIANLNLSRPWGAAQVMAVLHRDNARDADRDAGWGYAVGAGLKWNVPAFGAHDQFGIQAAYARGALRYLSNDLQAALPSLVDDFNNMVGDTRGTQAQGYSVEAGYTHAFSATVSGAIEASFVRYFDAIDPLYDLVQWDTAASLTWTPVTDFDITAGAGYRATRFNHIPGNSLNVENGHGWVVGLRMDRRF